MHCSATEQARAGGTGAGEGIRTPDRLITNQELYQLSYASLISVPRWLIARMGANSTARCQNAQR